MSPIRITSVTETSPSFPFSRNEAISDGSHKLGEITKSILEVKQEYKESLLNNTKERYFGSYFIDGDFGLIFGDIGNVIFSCLSIAQICMPALASSASFSWSSCILGSLGGLFNIGVGIYSLKLAEQSYKGLSDKGKDYIEEHGTVASFIHSMKGDAPEDVQKYYRLLWDGIFMIGIGAVMTVVSLSLKVAALGSIGAFLATNPWVLPLLWFLITIPLLIEVTRVNKNIWQGADLAGAMELNTLRNSLETDTSFSSEQTTLNETNPLKKRPIGSPSDADLFNYENNIMQELQTSIGVEAAIEAMQLRSLLLKEARKEDIEKQLERLEIKIAEWNKTQKWRLAQQIFLIASFAFSMIGLSPKVSQKAIGIATNGAILLGNLIPLAMDIAWPFRRNCYMVVPKAEESAVMQKVNQLAEASFKIA